MEESSLSLSFEPRLLVTLTNIFADRSTQGPSRAAGMTSWR
jgi:hypothetical protein